MSLLGDSGQRPIREEIVGLAATLADTQARLHQLAARLEHSEGDSWQQRYEELAASHKEAVNGAKWLRAQNLDLESRLESQKPEIHNAVAAREDAFRKLKHTRKVIRDLLTERGDMSSPRSNGGGTVTQEQIDRALDDEFGHQNSDSSSSESDKTVRIHVTNSPLQIESNGSGRSMANSVGRGGVISPARSVTNLAETTSPKTSSPRAGPSNRLSFESLAEVVSRVQSPNGSEASEEPWRIHFKNPPGVSTFQEGPITWDRLEMSLNLDDDTVNSLHSLASSQDVSMRLEITHYERKATVACLYDPILVDLPGKSYLLDWGRQRSNQNLTRYISTHKAADATFHTFLFPPSENNWFYIGALEWTAAQVPDFWPLFDENSKKRTLKKLVKRTKGEVEETEMARLLDSGELQQFCIELTAIGDARISYDFAAVVLGRQSSPYSPSRHERRAAGVKE